MADFKPGDVVRLKSGGPNMTVTGRHSETGRILCQWFVGTKLERGTFTPDALVFVDESESKKK